MKILFTLIISLISFNTLSQIKFKINDFSKKYKGTIIIKKGFESEVFKKGKILITERKTNKKIIEVKSNELTFELNKHDSIKTNKLKLPYKKQGVLIYQDFNFDGVKDLAVMNGQFSCYHGPSFQIYLETKHGLKLSTEFTKLAQDYCGMFQVNHQTKTIHTITKSGCCWHKYTDFIVANNIPKPILMVIEESIFDSPFTKRTETRWNGDKKNVEITKHVNLEQEGVTKITSFELIKNKKQVVIFNINNRILYYTLIKPNKTLEFSYPIELGLKNTDFKINKTEDKLTFSNNGVTYKVYNTRYQNKIIKVGIIVDINGKTYDLKGNINSLKGSLENVKKVKLYNVVNE